MGLPDHASDGEEGLALATPERNLVYTTSPLTTLGAHFHYRYVFGQQIEAGTLFMNRCDYLDPALAWTGVKHSGRGVSLSRIGYEHLTRAKSFHLRHSL